MNRMLSLALCSLLFSPLALAEEVVTFPERGHHLARGTIQARWQGAISSSGVQPWKRCGMLSRSAFEALGPVFASRGWVFFGPYRRGQGLSVMAGPCIGDQIAAAERSGGTSVAAAEMSDFSRPITSTINWRRLLGCENRTSSRRIVLPWPAIHLEVLKLCSVRNVGTTARLSSCRWGAEFGERP